MIERGAIKVVPLEVDGGWSGVRVDIAEDYRPGSHRQFDILASPKGAKFQIVPRSETWRALSIRLPDGSTASLSFYDERWHLNVYDPTGHYMGSIDEPEKR